MKAVMGDETLALSEIELEDVYQPATQKFIVRTRVRRPCAIVVLLFWGVLGVWGVIRGTIMLDRKLEEGTCGVNATIGRYTCSKLNSGARSTYVPDVFRASITFANGSAVDCSLWQLSSGNIGDFDNEEDCDQAGASALASPQPCFIEPGVSFNDRTSGNKAPWEVENACFAQRALVGSNTFIVGIAAVVGGAIAALCCAVPCAKWIWKDPDMYSRNAFVS